jgi:ATP-dependent protease ClpP protease subunit
MLSSPVTTHKATFKTVEISGTINIDTVNKVLDVANILPEEIRVIINSPGGEVQAAEGIIGVFLYLQSDGVTIRCMVDGIARSAAFWILQACGERISTPGSTFLVHEPFAVFDGHGKLEIDELQIMHDELQGDSEKMAAVSAPRMGLTISQFHEKIRNKNWTMTSSEAIVNHALDSIYKGPKEGFTQ